MEDWKEYKLGDVCQRLKSGKGINAQKISIQGKYPVIGGNGLRGYTDEANFIGQAAIIGRQGAYCGNVRYFNGAGYMTEHAIVVVGNELANTKYLSCKLSLMKLGHLSAQSAQPGLSVQLLSKLPIKLPTIEEQNAVAAIIQSLDDKIELNRRINDNLEQQAQALFKAWFVDFEPFKDGKFVDSELGRIPEGWKIVEANYFMTISKESINPTKNPACLYTHYSIPAFDEALTPEIQYGREIKSNKFLVYSGMTLFSKLNPRIKRIWFIDEAPNNSICSTEFIPYKSLGANCYFLYCYLNSKMFYDQAISLVNGATGSHQRFHPNETLKFLFAYKKGIVEKFNAIVTPTLKEMSKLSIENRKLTRLRDTLLPRLMSGELNVNTITG